MCVARVCSAAEPDRAEFAMQRKLKRQQSKIAMEVGGGGERESEEGDLGVGKLRRFGKPPSMKLLDESRITDLPVDVGDDSPVIMHGPLKKRIVTRTVLWVERYARRTHTLAHSRGGRARERESEREREIPGYARLTPD